MLLGSSSAEQFLLVLAEEDITRANEFLARAADAVAQFSSDTLHLVWASTENLGAWPVARKRLDDALLAKNSAPLAANTDSSFFAPLPLSQNRQTTEGDATSYFGAFAQNLPSASRVS